MKNILKKLYTIQGEQLKFKKDKTNPFFHSQYLTLDALNEGLNPILQKHKLVIYHYTENKEVKTSVADIESGETITSSFPIQEGLEPQKVGSTITYGKRYNVGQLFNIITDEDDDGNSSINTPNSHRNAPVSQDTPQTGNIPQKSLTGQICSKCGATPRVSKTSGKMYCPNSYQGDKKIPGHTIIQNKEKVIQIDDDNNANEEAFLANMGV
jgi:hypothetical protein